MGKYAKLHILHNMSYLTFHCINFQFLHILHILPFLKGKNRKTPILTTLKWRGGSAEVQSEHGLFFWALSSSFLVTFCPPRDCAWRRVMWRTRCWFSGIGRCFFKNHFVNTLKFRFNDRPQAAPLLSLFRYFPLNRNFLFSKVFKMKA